MSKSITATQKPKSASFLASSSIHVVQTSFAQVIFLSIKLGAKMYRRNVRIWRKTPPRLMNLWEFQIIH